MKKMSTYFLLAILGAWSCAAPPQLDRAEEEEPFPATLKKHPLDQSQYRRLVLDNGIEVLLVSDPRFNKSAAALGIDVGSLSSPRKRQGLVHFLEHMLFMGTQKYPEVDEYIDYLAREMDLVLDSIDPGREVSQLHLGGGTPTFLSLAQIERLHDEVSRRFRIRTSR